MNIRKPLIFSILMALSTACTIKRIGGLEPASVGSPDPEDASASAGVADASTTRTSEQTETAITATATDRRYSASCPDGMREVAGEYCASVEHRCLKGRDVTFSVNPSSPEGLLIQKVVPWTCENPKGCPVPYYCDTFLKGHAVCGLKADKTPDKTTKHFCIDDGEYPNVAGQMPRVFVTWNEANDLCGAQGKRLCGDDEWTVACEGNEHLPYPYGWERDAAKCYIDGRKADGPRPVLSSPDCVSPFGVHDMTGNVDEWTVNVTGGGRPYVSLFKGGHWVELARSRCRPATKSHGPTFSFYAEGFRCCADPRPATR